MEFIFEFLIELIFEGTLSLSQNKKVPKFIRYPLIVIIILLFLSVSLLIFYTGILAYNKLNKVIGIAFIIIGIVFLIISIFKFKKMYLIKNNQRNVKL